MAIFASRRDLKKMEASLEAASTVTVDVPIDGEGAADSVAVSTPLEAGIVAGTPSADVTASSGGGATAASLPVPTTSDSVDIEPVDIEPVDIEAPTAGTVPLAFGIADAIRLMRSLPADPNMDLVVRVVRVTLGAVNVSVEEIMADAARKEGEIKESITTLETQIADLEKQLYTRRCEIAAHEGDLKETVSVRERLHMADKYSGPRPPPPPADATRIVNPKPSEWAAEWDRAELSKRG